MWVKPLLYQRSKDEFSLSSRGLQSLDVLQKFSVSGSQRVYNCEFHMPSKRKLTIKEQMNGFSECSPNVLSIGL